MECYFHAHTVTHTQPLIVSFSVAHVHALLRVSMATLTFYTAHVQISHVGCVWAAEMLQQGAVLVFVVCLLAAPGGIAEDCCVKVDTSTRQLVDVNGQTAQLARETDVASFILPSLCVFGLQVEPASFTESMW